MICLLGVDLGTSGTKTVLFDTDGSFLKLDCFQSHSACVGTALFYVEHFLAEF